MNWKSGTFFLTFALGTAAWTGACGGATGNGGLSSGISDAGDANDGGTHASTGDAAATHTGGTGDAGNTDTPTVCTSQQTWTRGDRGSPLMHPGGTCITCHDANGGPSFSIAGTVFPTAHEPDDCDGVTGTATLQVVITDANNQTTTLTVNSAGNFYSAAAIATPFSAKVVSGTRERAMTDTQTSGDCNSCHTVDGANGAPGRIMAP
jgi:hypothetical protein